MNTLWFHLHEEPSLVKIIETRDFPGGPAVKNLPCNAEDLSSIPGQGTKISDHSGTSASRACLLRQQSPRAASKDPVWLNRDPEHCS